MLLGASTVVLSVRAAGAAPTAVSLSGTFDSEIGCSADWQPACPQAQMAQRTDGKWAATFNLPGGTFDHKVAINNSWTENYGAGGAAGGANIQLTVPAGGKSVTFVASTCSSGHSGTGSWSDTPRSIPHWSIGTSATCCTVCGGRTAGDRQLAAAPPDAAPAARRRIPLPNGSGRDWLSCGDG